MRISTGVNERISSSNALTVNIISIGCDIDYTLFNYTENPSSTRGNPGRMKLFAIPRERHRVI